MGRMALDLTVDSLRLIAEVIRSRQCILFLGAGAHAPPPDDEADLYPAAQRPPIGAQLSRQLADACGLAERFPAEDVTNLQRVSLFYEIQRSRHHLVDAVRNAVQVGKRPSPMLETLARMDFPLVITTNYDQLFENALAAVGKQPRVAVYTPALEPTTDYRDPTPESPVVFKIHGDISRPETIVITDEDYIQFVLRMSSKDPYDPLPLTLKFFLTTWTTLFVGYSLLDYNLRLLFKTLRWRIDNSNLPDVYSVDFRPDPLIVDVWHNQRRYVKFIAQDLWKFVPALAELVEAPGSEP
jgi:hypothetical protein